MKIKQMMKYLAFMLCCLMLVSIIPMNAQAAGKGNLPENVSKADKVYFGKITVQLNLYEVLIS